MLTTQEIKGLTTTINESSDINEKSTEDIRKRAEYLYEILRCPTCQNIPIKDSHSEMAELMKKIILEKLQEGWNEKQIIDFFVQRYGDEILLYPGNAILNYIPFLLFAIGLISLIIIIQKTRRTK
ncbi:MAG: cytochrome c-type biogenesis protein CcmH [Candidatus Calescibacterium sp.]|nr:cytochrome c-type biogenesis protein CcmH [Candidatus Calescibacterium sp.]MCX7734374.1 cytochrome c-type biogenesis protein CcmH [bacterium]MDW8086862.1 cytochrome c-type biogenesis protein CcmH [Candidatus Calescibacterium sp.]